MTAHSNLLDEMNEVAGRDQVVIAELELRIERGNDGEIHSPGCVYTRADRSRSGSAAKLSTLIGQDLCRCVTDQIATTNPMLARYAGLYGEIETVIATGARGEASLGHTLEHLDVMIDELRRFSVGVTNAIANTPEHPEVRAGTASRLLELADIQRERCSKLLAELVTGAQTEENQTNALARASRQTAQRTLFGDPMSETKSEQVAELAELLKLVVTGAELERIHAGVEHWARTGERRALEFKPSMSRCPKWLRDELTQESPGDPVGAWMRRLDHAVVAMYEKLDEITDTVPNHPVVVFWESEPELEYDSALLAFPRWRHEGKRCAVLPATIAERAQMKLTDESYTPDEVPSAEILETALVLWNPGSFLAADAVAAARRV